MSKAGSDAASGLADGRYAAVVTIPENFSRAATSVADADAAEQAVIQVTTSPASAVEDAQIARQIADLATQSTNQMLTGEYLKNIYIGFNTMGEQFVTGQTIAEALANSAELSSGGVQLASGARELSGGVTQYTDGAGKLVDGISQLDTGVQAYTSGAGQLVGGGGPRVEVNHVEGRVADRLAEHRLGALVDQRFQRGDVVVGG